MQMKTLTKIYGAIPRRPEHLTVRTVGIIKEDNGTEVKLLSFRLHYGEGVIEFPVRYELPRGCEGEGYAVILENETFSKTELTSARFLISLSSFFSEGRLTDTGRALLHGRRQVGVSSLLAFAAVRAAEYARSISADAEITLTACEELCEAALVAAFIEKGFSKVALISPRFAPDELLSKTAEFTPSIQREKMRDELIEVVAKRCKVTVNQNLLA